MDLKESREQIDFIDKEITKLFQKRMIVAEEIAKYKKETGKKIFDKAREEEKLSILEEYAENEFNKQGIRELFTQIMSISRKYQYSLLAKQEEVLFEQRTSLEYEGKKAVFYGERGTYTEQAMEAFFGTEIESFNALTFREVMEAVENGEADFGVLPIENSSTGGINDNLDLLTEYNNYIIGEQVVKIDQCLLGLPGSTVEDVRKVYSHSQGILQCKKYLENYPYIKKIPYMSTATCAKKVKDDQDKSQAAIASKRSAQYYGLSVLAENINYESNNSTRFIIITRERYYLKDANKVSVSFQLPHESGTLYNILSHFIFNNLNLTKIESRPIEGKKWEYRFFVEFEGNLEDAGVKNAWNGIQEETLECRILGNFKSE